jgi:hypothetical protein
VDRANKRRVVIVLPEFPSHLPNEHINVTIIRVPFPVPNSIHELVASHDLAGFLNQRQQQPELSCR